MISIPSLGLGTTRTTPSRIAFRIKLWISARLASASIDARTAGSFGTRRRCRPRFRTANPIAHIVRRVSEQQPGDIMTIDWPGAQKILPRRLRLKNAI
jgi:hypothetical protein